MIKSKTYKTQQKPLKTDHNREKFKHAKTSSKFEDTQRVKSQNAKKKKKKKKMWTI